MINLQYETKHFILVSLLGALLCIMVFGDMPEAQAQERPHHREFRDTRYNHNHYYPLRGEYISVLPRSHRVVIHDGNRYFFSGGIWYRPYGARFIVVAPPIGLVIPILPPYYETVRISGVPYYYANEIYYIQSPGGYMVVNPPTTAPVTPAPATHPPSSTAPTAERTFIYPRQGQTEKQQADDRYACHRWAVDQTGFDPTQTSGSISPAQQASKQADYQRAQSACLEGRGYTVK